MKEFRNDDHLRVQRLASRADDTARPIEFRQQKQKC